MSTLILPPSLLLCYFKLQVLATMLTVCCSSGTGRDMFPVLCLLPLLLPLPLDPTYALGPHDVSFSADVVTTNASHLLLLLLLSVVAAATLLQLLMLLPLLRCFRCC